MSDSPEPPPTMSVQVCCPDKVLCLLSGVLRGRANSPTLCGPEASSLTCCRCTHAPANRVSTTQVRCGACSPKCCCQWGTVPILHSHDLRASFPIRSWGRSSLLPLYHKVDEGWGQVAHAHSLGQTTCVPVNRVSSAVLPWCRAHSLECCSW